VDGDRLLEWQVQDGWDPLCRYWLFHYIERRLG
jgi:hypothetical protein